MALYLLVATVAAPFFSRKPKVEKKPAEGENIGEGKVRHCCTRIELARERVATSRIARETSICAVEQRLSCRPVVCVDGLKV